MSDILPSTAPALPGGFKPLQVGGDFTANNGPLYIRSVVQPDGNKLRHMGFRVEQRHTNPMGNCHGGMLATFACAAGEWHLQDRQAVRVASFFRAKRVDSRSRRSLAPALG